MSIKKILKNNFNIKGFTLIEMIVTIIFIGIFATLALTRSQSGISIIQEQIAIDQITNDIDLARSMAFAKHETITIVFSKTDGKLARPTIPFTSCVSLIFLMSSDD